ncbi:hypothetical protein HK097_005957 [Rhizophlyctis rosea]|uniref:Uncharacterized protein n=1 Tax=Rhizophlyctis rosea TaxID=64517 RepID=A0AAD5SJV0_9FUNG|nr:hypothetical protein HK097_005957 [Rhizophlyctis rosea]
MPFLSRLYTLTGLRLSTSTPSYTIIHSLRVPRARPFCSSYPNLESNSTRRKADSDRPFPWRLKAEPDRDTIDNCRPTTFLSPLTDYFKREFTRMLARSYTNTAYGHTYFQIPFPGGAALAFDKLCTTITEYTNPSSSQQTRDDIDESLRTMLDRPLYKRISSACSTAVDKNERVVLSATIHDVRVNDIHIRFGPPHPSSTSPAILRTAKDVTVFTLGEHYIFNWFTLSWMFPKEDVQSREQTTFKLAVASMDEGAVVSIDAVVDVDIVFRHVKSVPAPVVEGSESSRTEDQAADLASKITSELSSSSSSRDSSSSASPSHNEKTISTESCRREITVQFTSPHITVRDAQEGNALSVGSWRISDIDYLIAGDVLEKYVARLERQAEESEQA